ncbi:MAG: hypothetical protein EOO65_03380 [Methanosarcinales archaeon]|nr:MAG: hypothetical protein EOO65_03380 [Methanosarcinales archaeon]
MMVIMVNTAFMKAAKVVSTVHSSLAWNAVALRKELEAVMERFKKGGLPVAATSDIESVPLSANASLVEDNGITLQMKCLAHSAQVCLKHFFLYSNDVIEFLAAMRSLTKRSKSFKLRASAREKNISMSKFDFTPTRWSPCAPGLIAMLKLSHWVSVHEWVRELRKKVHHDIVPFEADEGHQIHRNLMRRTSSTGTQLEKATVASGL